MRVPSRTRSSNGSAGEAVFRQGDRDDRKAEQGKADHVVHESCRAGTEEVRFDDCSEDAQHDHQGTTCHHQDLSWSSAHDQQDPTDDQ